MWLVKWFLAIPHLIVLFFLWFALIVTSIVAWFAILFTARYPRSLFNFNVGRAALELAGVLLRLHGASARTATRLSPWPAPTTRPTSRWTIPEHLSRGLVLVKSWLLAIPHLLIVAVLAGTARTWVDGVAMTTWVPAATAGGAISLLWGCWSSSPASSCCSPGRYLAGACSTCCWASTAGSTA